ncbi:uncharacterized protein L201_001600 [Kwoniella dendrophila CBS 6074]|uniref:DUSP domain-containing protein n=1 Tax=Kwoniella dendrophila CBS 6074 TaxID=1295534 RepID=A0AAX4JMR7_9TREE
MGSSHSHPTNPPQQNQSQPRLQSTSSNRSRPLAPVPPLTPSRQTILNYFFAPNTKTGVIHEHSLPTYDDCKLVESYLRFRGLPNELIPRILDYAEYWSSCKRKNSKRILVRSNDNTAYLPDSLPPPRSEDGLEALFCSGQSNEIPLSSRMNPNEGKRGGGGLYCENGKIWYLLSSPIGCTSNPQTDLYSSMRPSQSRSNSNMSTRTRSNSRLTTESDLNENYDQVWVRKCIIETLSKDQGWSSGNPAHYGTYEQSYSWFEISLLRGDKEVENSRHSIQNNVHAGQYYKSHTVTLHSDHPTLKLVEPGDRIVLWVRAQYQGWMNWVKEASISVYTSPYPP